MEALLRIKLETPEIKWFIKEHVYFLMFQVLSFLHLEIKLPFAKLCLHLKKKLSL